MRLYEIRTQSIDFLYHATSIDNLESIRKSGIVDGYWANIEIAQYYAKVIVDEGNKYIIIKVPFSEFDQSKLLPDKPGLEEPITTVIISSEKEIWDTWKKSRKTWMDCWNLIGSVRYSGTIKINDHEIIGENN